MVRRDRGQRGLSESVQWSVLVPLLLFTVLGAIQAGVLVHGRTVAANAALAGAEAEALAGGGAGTGPRVASEVAQRGGLLDVRVESVRTDAVVTVTVRGRVDTFVDLGLSAVEQSAQQPVEVPR